MNSSSFLKTLLAILALALAGLTAASAQFTTQAIPGGVRITGYTGTVPANLVIPLQIGGTVLEIGTGAFQNQDTITTLTLPTSLTTIGANAFRDCDNLGSVFIPASVTSIGTGAFAACDRLASIEVDDANGAYDAENGVLYDIVTSAGDAILHQYPAGRQENSFSIPAALSTGELVIEIADRAFEESQNLLSMEIANNVTTIGDSAFANALRLARVTIDLQVNTIRNNAFSFNGTGPLTFATFLGNAPTSFGTNVFGGSAAGFEVRYLQGNTFGPNAFTAPTWKAYNSRTIQKEGVLTYRIVGSAVEILSPEPGAPAAIVIPSTIAGLPVRTIAANAFVGDTNISSLTLPTSLTTIGQDAFYGCSSLNAVGLAISINAGQLNIPANITNIGVGAFGNCPGLTSIEVAPANQNYSARGNVLFNKSQTILELYPVSGPSSYEIPSSVQTIRERAFEGNRFLAGIEFGLNVTTIGNRAFYNNESLVSVRFGRNVNSIGNQAFATNLGALSYAVFLGNAPSVFGTNVFQGTPSDFQILYLGGASGFTNPWNGYPTATLEQDQNFLFTTANRTVEVVGFTGTPPGPGDLAQVVPDLTTRPEPNFVGVTSDLIFSTPNPPPAPPTPYTGNIPNHLALPVGYLFHDLTTDTIWEFVEYIIYTPTGAITNWKWKVYNTNNARLNLNRNVSLGTTVIEQNDSAPIIYQKIANPGSNVSDWIEVDFEIPKTIAGLPVTSIAPGAFANNMLLRSVVMPATVIRIGTSAFAGCSQLGVYNQLNGVFLPAAVSQVGQDAFFGCETLQNIFVHELNPIFKGTDGVLFNKEQTKLVQYPPAKLGISYSIPQTIQEILPGAFRGNRFLSAITLPDSVRIIGDDAFRNSASLVQVTIGNGITSIGNNAFRDSVALGSAIFNGNAPATIGTNMFDGTAPVEIQYYNGFSGFTPTPPNWSSYTIAPLSAIGDFIFAIEGTGSSQTATITGYKGTGGAVQIPEKFGQLAVRKIGDNAFLGKIGITSVRIPNSVSSIGEAAFKGVSTLAAVTFGSGLTSIGKEAFYGCNELTEVSISAAITSIGEAAFAACEKLIAIKVDPNNSNYRSTRYLNGAGEVLFDRTQKKLVQYPAGIQQSTYEIPATVETIGKRAFEGAVYLSVIEFPATVKTIEARAFYNTAALVTVRFGRGVTTIQDEAFAGIITPLNSAIFYGAAPTSFGTNVFQGALPTFEVRYLVGAQGFPATGANWTGYKQVPIAEISEFEFRLIDNNTKIEITGYTGLAPTITADRSTLPTPNLVVPDRAARLALTSTSSLQLGTLVLQQDQGLIYTWDIPPNALSPRWYVFDNSGARFLLPSALPLGTVVLEQNGVSKVYYQKIGLPGAGTSNWIVVDFRIPDTLSGLPVTSIADRAFENNPVIQSVVLPNSLTKIGVKAFAGCSQLGGLVSGNTLGGVFLPASVTTYGAGAFASCGLLQQIIAHPSNQVYSSTDGVLFNKRGTQLVQFPAGLATTTYFFPEAVTDIAGSAFEGNAYLAELEFPKTIRTIGAEAFQGSKTLVSVLFGSGLSSLGNQSFAAIPSLGEAIFFGDSPTTIGVNVFQGAAQDFKVFYVQGAKGFPAGASGTWSSNKYPAQAITAFEDFDFQTVSGGAEILSYLGDISDIRFEPDLTTLPRANQIVTNQASRLALPAGLPTGWNVLELSTNLLWYVESQTAATDNSPAQNNWAVRVTSGDRLLLDSTVPVGTTFKEQSATAALFYQKVAMPGNNAANWIRISGRTLRIPETIAGLPVVSIAKEAFDNTRLLESVVFPNTLKTIGDFAFKSCPRLGLPDGYAGDNRGVFIPLSVGSIGVGVFSNCISLSEIRVNPANKSFSDIDGVLYNKAQTQLIAFPGGRFSENFTVASRVTRIADYAFEGNANLESLVIPPACTDIGIGAFQGALSLTSVTVGNGVRRIGDLAFANIASLDNVTFQGNAPQLLGPDVFANRSSGFRILFNARSTGFSVEPWKSLPIQPVWLSGSNPASTGFRAVGYVDPAPFNNNIGGQIQLAVSRSRIASGVLILGTNATASNGAFASSAMVSGTAPGSLVSHRFRGEMAEDGRLVLSIPRRGESDLELDIQFELLEAPTFFKLKAGSVLSDGDIEAEVFAAMIPWSGTVSPQPFAGIYNIGFDAETGGQLVAPGDSFTGLTVDGRTGAARLVGVLGDGTRFTGASWVLGDGSIPLWFPLYMNNGMLVGEMLLGPGGTSVDSNILWSKPADVPRSPDPDGFNEVLLTASPGSGRFVAPDLKNKEWRDKLDKFTLNFQGESLSGANFLQGFKLDRSRIVPVEPNLNQVRAAWNLRSGLVQGTFTIPDADQPFGATRPIGRLARFQGIILSDGKPESFQVRGNFVLPNSSTRPTIFFGGSVSNN